MCRGGGLPGCFLPSAWRACFVGSLRGARARGPRRADFSARDRALFRLGTDGWFALADASGKLDASPSVLQGARFLFFSKTSTAGQAGCPARRASPTSLGRSLTPAPSTAEIWSRTVQHLAHFKRAAWEQPEDRAARHRRDTKAAAKNDVRLRHLRPSLRGGAAGHG